MLKNCEARAIAVDRTTPGNKDAELTVPMKQIVNRLEQNPCEIDQGLEHLRSRYTWESREAPFALGPFSPVYASARFIKDFIHDPFRDMAERFPPQSAESVFTQEVAVGLEIAADALIRAEGAYFRGGMRKSGQGIKEQVAIELDQQLAGEPPEKALAYKKEYGPMRVIIAARQLARYMADRNGGVVLMGEYNDAVDMSMGIDPYSRKQSQALKDVWNSANVTGVVFAIELYRQVYPRAKALFS